MTIVINQIHPAFTNVQTYNESLELFVFFMVKHPFQYQGKKIIGIDFHSINPELDSALIKRGGIIRIEFNENQARVIETNVSKRFRGWELKIDDNNDNICSVKPYQTFQNLSFQLTNTSPTIQGSRCVLSIQPQRLPEDNFNNGFERIILQIPDNKISHVQAWIRAIGADTEHAIEGIKWNSASFDQSNNYLIVRKFAQIVKKNETNNHVVTSDTPKFTIKNVLSSSGVKFLTFETFNFQGKEIKVIRINSNNPNLQKDSQVIIKDVRLASDQAKMNNSFLFIDTYFSDIEIVTVGISNGNGGDIPLNHHVVDIFQKAINNNDSKLINLINKYEGLDNDIVINVIAASMRDDELTSDHKIDYTKLEHIIQVQGFVLKEKPKKPTNNNLIATRNKAITAITQVLDQEPKITSSELSKTDWEIKINNSSDINFINNFQVEMLTEIQEKRKVKVKNSELDQLISQAERTSTCKELELLIKKIRTLSALPRYQEKQNKIRELEVKLGKLDLNKYKNDAIESIDNELNGSNNTVKSGDLEAENKDYKKQLNDAQTPEQVNQIRERVKNNVLAKKTEKELISLLEKSKVTTNKREKSIIRDKILQFMKEENTFKKNITIAYKQQIKTALAWLENNQSTFQSDDNSGVFAYLLIGSVVISILIIIVLLNINRKKVK